MAIYDWLAVLRKEYLQEFIKNGGAGVKFVVPWEPSSHLALQDGLSRMAREEGYAFVSVDSATTKVQMVDKVFNEVARQIDWDELAHAFLCSTLLDSEYLVPADREEFNLAQIAYLNGLDVGEMRAVINNRLRERLSHDYNMTHEFRQAMLKLCQAQLDPQGPGSGDGRGGARMAAGRLATSLGLEIGRHFSENRAA
jgi:hypothetical protein